MTGSTNPCKGCHRRHLVVREKKIKARLEVLQKTRKLHRESRKKQDIPTIAILGYTNAGIALTRSQCLCALAFVAEQSLIVGVATGKSALLNRLCGTSLVSQNQLFASLHTFMRKCVFPPSSDQCDTLAHRVAIRIELPSGGCALAADTVGTASALPALIDGAWP